MPWKINQIFCTGNSLYTTRRDSYKMFMLWINTSVSSGMPWDLYDYSSNQIPLTVKTVSYHGRLDSSLNFVLILNRANHYYNLFVSFEVQSNQLSEKYYVFKLVYWFLIVWLWLGLNTSKYISTSKWFNIKMSTIHINCIRCVFLSVPIFRIFVQFDW